MGNKLKNIFSAKATSSTTARKTGVAVKEYTETEAREIWNQYFEILSNGKSTQSLLDDYHCSGVICYQCIAIVACKTETEYLKRHDLTSKAEKYVKTKGK